MKFKNHLENIKVTLMNYPTMDELKTYIPEFVSITWLEHKEDINKFMEERKLSREDLVKEMFAGRTLPTALENVRLTFFIEGLDLTGVTHIIRHRMFSFSAQSTDPVSMENHDILDNDAFIDKPHLLVRAHNLCKEMNALYKDALAEGMTFYDARHYMPRAKEAKYFMSGNIKDFLGFIKIRLGKQCQPTSDRILALKMRKEILKVYPFLNIPTENIEWAYINAIDKKMNLNTFPPTKLHEAKLEELGIDWSKCKFSHPNPKRKYSHLSNFKKIERELI